MKILIVSDAWEPQVNGVVRTLKMTRRELERQGHQTEIISPLGFRSIPCPTYPEISLALTTAREMERRIDRFAPDFLVPDNTRTLAIVPGAKPMKARLQETSRRNSMCEGQAQSRARR